MEECKCHDMVYDVSRIGYRSYIIIIKALSGNEATNGCKNLKIH